MATNSALLAVMTSMPIEQQQQALKAFAELTVMKEQTVEQLPNQEAKAALREVLASEERVYQAMQGAHKMRTRKLQQKGD
ncbi:hypothetical protein [Variovorax boronicumulans]